MIHVRSSRGKNSQGRKVTGIEPMPGEDKVIAWHHLNIGRYDIVRVKLALQLNQKGNIYQ